MRSPRYLAPRGLNLLLLGASLAAAPLAAQTPAPSPTTAPAPAAAPAPRAALDYDSLAFGRQLTEWFYAGQTDSLFAHSDSAMQVNFGKDKWTQATMQWISHAGEETSVVEERWVRRNGLRQYWRVVQASGFPDGPVMLRWVLTPGKRIAGVGMNPASQAPAVDPN